MGICLFYVAGELDEKVDLVRDEAFALATRKTRASQWNRFYGFCDTHGLRRFPVYPCNVHVCRFLVFMSPNVCYSTLNNYVSALNVLLKLNDRHLELRQDFGVELTEGVEKAFGSRDCTDRRAPSYP